MNKAYLYLKFDANTGAGGGTPPPPEPAKAPPAAGAATPPPAAAGGSNTPSPAPGGWYDSFKNEEIKNFVKTREFKDPEMLADSYINLEKLKGVPADRLLKLPAEADSPEWAGVFERLGTPKTAEEYKIDPIKDDAASAEFTKWAKDTFHGEKLTTKQAESLAKKFTEFAQGVQAKQIEAMQQVAKQSVDELKGKWGNAYDQNTKIADNAARMLGIDENTVKALGGVMGPVKAVEFLHKLGSSIGEDRFIDGSAGGGAKPMSPDMAKAHISAKKADKAYMAKYASGDAQAVKEMNKLHEDAFPGMF